MDISQILNDWQFVPFVQRILNKDKYPVINNSDGTYSTHKLSWGSIGDKYVVFPQIEMVDGKLTNLLEAGIDPFNYAMNTRNYIQFDSPDDADFFTKNYKSYWDKK